MSDEPITREQADRLALAFLRDNGPHTMGLIERDEDVAAAMIFIDLEKTGLVRRVMLAPGRPQYSITTAGLKKLAA